MEKNFPFGRHKNVKKRDGKNKEKRKNWKVWDDFLVDFKIL